jgi:hypothetical protein
MFFSILDDDFLTIGGSFVPSDLYATIFSGTVAFIVDVPSNPAD